MFFLHKEGLTMDIMKFHIMYGLPGSGKTYFCSTQCENTNQTYIDLDYELRNNHQNFENSLRKLINEHCSCGFEDYYLDGLFTTKESLSILISVISEVVEKRQLPTDIVIHAWNEDRETCMKNDFKRRSLSSESSIKNMPFDEVPSLSSKFVDEIISPEKKKAINNISICRHMVVLKPEYKTFFDKVGLFLSEENEHICWKRRSFKQSKYLISQRWSLGGTVCSYTGATSIIGAESPREFSELDDLLISIDEDLPYLLYKKIYNDCVKIVETNESDYYGGNETFNHYELDLEAMYYLIDEWKSKEFSDCMTNKKKVLNQLSNDVEKLAKLLIRYKDVTGWDELPSFEYLTSDEQTFEELKMAVNHEIEWLNAKTV